MHKDILQLIGNTPLVKINKLNSQKNVELYAKLEFLNPGGSVKDRIALSMIEGAERRKELTKNKIVLEATSGNTGIGLALVCAVKGYRLLLTMPETVSVERRKILKALGAEILLTPTKDGTDGAIERAYEMAREIAKKEGIFVGMSSGAAIFGALQIIKDLKRGLIVVLFPDGGERYLSTNLFD